MRNRTGATTAMFDAFADIRVVIPQQLPAGPKRNPLVARIVSSMERHTTRRSKGSSCGWDANLSFRTHRHLSSKGDI